MDTITIVQVEPTAPEIQVCLQELLVRLHALYAIHRSAHWTVLGESYYGDHLLFQRLYEPLDDEIDTLAERLVAKFGPEVVDPVVLASGTSDLVEMWCAEDPCPWGRAQRAEDELVTCVDACMESIDASGELTLGWEDFLGSITSKHEEHLYLLGQRIQ